MTAEKKKNVHAGHRKRMRERFINGGLTMFEPHEVLELLLFEFIPVVNTNPIGHALIDAFGSVKGVLTAPYSELVKVPGIGPKAAEGILSIYPFVSNDICDWFRREGALTRYDLAFLADWFMRGAESPLGILILGADGCFADYLALPIVRKDGMIDAEYMFSDLGGKYENCNFSLFVQPEDRFSVEEISEIRRYTFRASFILDEIYVMNGREPVPTLFADRFHD